VKYLENMRRNDARGFTALYQGRPTPLDGAFFKSDFVRTYQRMSDMPPKENMRFYGASDHAVATGQQNDKSCLMIVGVDKDDDVWVMPDMIWGRMPSDMAVERMIDLMGKYKPMLWGAERGQITKSIGPFLRKRMLERRIFCGIDEITPTTDKQQRAQAIHARIAMGKVHFPGFSRWWADANDQLLKFPNGTHDDFVDTLSLIGLMLSKMVPARKGVKKDDGPPRLTLGWIKEQTRRAERENANEGW
jgi:predicted phage terminase large subunit-like protein